MLFNNEHNSWDKDLNPTCGEALGPQAALLHAQAVLLHGLLAIFHDET
jgi:hypothetical protein